jgi:23S rRNA (guanine2445-N2)-methyltransferase / 23S rRNA (guanine2069-N7)-methyltransferase
VSDQQQPQWFAACPKGLESLLAQEIQTLGSDNIRETVAGVYFSSPLAVAYRVCLWSRLANRVLMPIAQLEVEDAQNLYDGLRQISWDNVFTADNTIAIDFSGQNDEIRNTQFGAQKSKDAIVDWFVDNGGKRPSVERKNPDIRLNLRLLKSKLHVSLDFSGGSLHRRGYRLKTGAAPLKENLAAALLLRADWPGIAARGGALIDPMCGSGTLLLEGALMIADVAPGLNRARFGFECWQGHNPQQWQAIKADAQGRAERGKSRQLPEIRGYDADPKVIRQAQDNIAKANLSDIVRVSCKSLSELVKPTHTELEDGLLICNPPYGERLGEKASLKYLYRQLGELMAIQFSGWQGAVFTSDLELGKATGLRSHKRYTLFNGAMESILLLFDLNNNTLRRPAGEPEPSARTDGERVTGPALSTGATMFANRIKKNRKRLSSWLKREQVSCYRLYDADMPEYSVAVDVYGDHIHVAEYQAPKGIDPEAAAKRLEEVTDALPQALGIPTERIVYKQRRQQRGKEQYQKQDDRGELLQVSEGGANFLINLNDYLDTGLFLDHRPLRMRLAAEAAGKDFLNLFCYTGTATVHVALANARSTTSVDMSNTYLGWLRKNLAANGLAENRNHLIRADCLKWLESCEDTFDLIMLDPPSFSNSKSMEGDFDVLRDQYELVCAAMSCLAPDGRLYFSTNRRGFKLAPEIGESFHCDDISRQTLDPDFARNQKIHQCWLLQHRDK